LKEQNASQSLQLDAQSQQLREVKKLSASQSHQVELQSQKLDVASAHNASQTLQIEVQSQKLALIFGLLGRIELRMEQELPLFAVTPL